LISYSGRTSGTGPAGMTGTSSGLLFNEFAYPYLYWPHISNQSPHPRTLIQLT
jgi:hypothetical protein